MARQRTLNKDSILAAVRAIETQNLNDVLSLRNQQIILERFDRDGGVKNTLREVAKKNKICITRVRDITVTGVRKILTFTPLCR